MKTKLALLPLVATVACGSSESNLVGTVAAGGAGGGPSGGAGMTAGVGAMGGAGGGAGAAGGEAGAAGGEAGAAGAGAGGAVGGFGGTGTGAAGSTAGTSSTGGGSGSGGASGGATAGTGGDSGQAGAAGSGWVVKGPPVGPCTFDTATEVPYELKDDIVIAFSWDKKQFVPNCLRTYSGSSVKFTFLSPGNGLMGMTANGTQPNPFSPGAPHEGDFKVVSLTAPEGSMTVYGFYSSAYGSEGPPGTTGASGAIYIAGSLPLLTSVRASLGQT